jgi:hypothetical protein
VTDDTVMTIWPDCAFLFLFLFFLTIFDKTLRLDFPARNGQFFFPLTQHGCMMTDGDMGSFLSTTSKRCMSAQATHKRARKTNGRKSSFTYIVR